jgi:NADH:ubiquinone oxidoreductase subunit E
MVRDSSDDPCRGRYLQKLTQNDEIPGITVCMGKSCYVRGNQENLLYIEGFLKQRGLDVRVDLRGKRCGESCASGPHITIGNSAYSDVTLVRLKGLLVKHYACM